MKFVPLALVFLHLSSQFSSSQSSLHVECNHNCKCDKSPTLDSTGTVTTVKCSLDLEMELIEHTFPWVNVSIRCKKPQVDLSVLYSLNLNITFAEANYEFGVSIEGCHLPDSPLSDLLDNIGVSYVRSLYITSCNGNWQRKHFKNLCKAEDLIISESHLGALPVDTFEGLTNLTMLNLTLSHFNLTESISHYAPKLKFVYLENNYESEVSLDVFKDLKDLRKLRISGHKRYNTTSVIFNSSKKFREIDFEMLVLSSIRIKFLTQVLKSKSNQILFKNNGLGLPIELRGIRQSKNLRKLVLSNIIATTFQLHPSCLADLTALKSVIVSGNHLRFVPEDSFSGSNNIIAMDLSNNLIDGFKKNTFSELEVLEILDLSRNRITHLPKSLFSGTRSLKILCLSNNQLTNIDQSLFSHMSKLTRLYLSHNKLRNISGEQFAQLKSLTVVDLSHNQLLSLLHDPLLSDLDQSVFYNCTQLRELHLQNNYLTEVYDDWRPQHSRNNLTLLNLAYNKITDIQALVLTNNTNFTQAQPDEIKSLDSYEAQNGGLTVHITNNTVNIDCGLNLAREGCEQQSSVKGCPVGCRCVYREFTRSFVVNCQNSSLLVQPPTLPVADPERADHTELSLYGNQLREFQLPDDPGYRSVTFLNLAHNFLTSLDITRVSKRLKKLDLSRNKLKRLSEDTLELLENALELQRLELTENSWTCDLSNFRLAHLISEKQILIRHKVRCADGSPTSRILSRHEAREAGDLQVILYSYYSVYSIVVVLLTTMIVLAVLYYRNRQKIHGCLYSSECWLLRCLVFHPDLADEDKLYDAFIVFAQEDEEFVVNHLVPYLEETQDRKYKLCLHFRDWIPGEQILSQIGRSVRSSRRTIVVLSPHFLRSVWAVEEFRVAHAQALKDGAARVIVVLLEDVPDEDVDEELEAYLQTNTYVKWGSPWFWQQLTYALPHPPGRERSVLHYFSKTQDVHTFES